MSQDYLLLTAAENGDMQNVNVALSGGANINVHHQDIRKVSIQIVAFAPLIATNFDRSKPFYRCSSAKHNKHLAKLNISLYNGATFGLGYFVTYETNNKTWFKKLLKLNGPYMHTRLTNNITSKGKM